MHGINIFLKLFGSTEHGNSFGMSAVLSTRISRLASNVTPFERLFDCVNYMTHCTGPAMNHGYSTVLWSLHPRLFLLHAFRRFLVLCIHMLQGSHMQLYNTRIFSLFLFAYICHN
jgi:hypothetical protein